MISIIIPAKNEEKYLPGILEDLKSQSSKDFEVIVAEKDSSDNTKGVAKQFGVELTQGGNHPSIGRNNGAKIAKGEILIFFDADVRIPKDFISEAENCFNKNKCGVACFYAKPNKNEAFYKILFFLVNLICFSIQKFKPRGGGFCIMVKKEIFEKIKGFNEKINLGEDIFFLEKAFKISKFRYFLNPKITLSVRRFEREGKWKLLYKYIKSSIAELKGKQVKDEIEYNFEYKKD